MRRALLLSGVVLLLFVAMVALLAFQGSPGLCGAGRDIRVSPTLAQSYEERWLQFNTTLTSGRRATLNVTDSEATSQAEDFLATSNAPLRDVRLCFVPGGGDANATVSTPLGRDIRVRLKGNVDLSGRYPRAQISSVQIGALPAFVTRPVRGIVTRIIDDQGERIELDHRLSVEVHEGEVTITGEP